MLTLPALKTWMKKKGRKRLLQQKVTVLSLALVLLRAVHHRRDDVVKHF